MCDFFLKFVYICFMPRNVAYLGEYFMSLRRMLLDEVVCRCSLYPVDWWYCWVQLCLYWFSVCWISPFLIVLMSLSTPLNSSISSCSSVFFLTYFDVLVRYVHVKDCSFFLKNWPLSHYVMPLFLPNNFPCSEVCLK